ncbi:hypothetical protein DSO57_1028141 [Entomophthora muscae]|uniref:Uncharacterized protein n=1 Tax=Entomophthora muscae TaxID=34485 RepID=A0ACC2TNY1_9FUNG|nr:hypothetical protein DSO57_1028141 [Entomophthora muscae]
MSKVKVATKIKVYPDSVLGSTSVYIMQSVVNKVKENKVLGYRSVESVSQGMFFNQSKFFHINGLVEAVNLAYAKHHGLTLSPDHIFIAILQGLAIHINLNPEKHKPVLGLTHFAEGAKEAISIVRDEFQLGNFNNDWPGVFPEFQAKIGKQVDSDVFALLSTKFSTSTSLSRPVASMATIDVFKPYFGYRPFGLCGIPEVVLLGTSRDWILLRENAIKLLSKFEGLDFWLKGLIPILDEFVEATSNNNYKMDFWSHIYRPDRASGGTPITGWINGLIPYLQREDVFYKNANVTWQKPYKKRRGLDIQNVPSGLKNTPFMYYKDEKGYEMAFVGGFMGVELGIIPNHVTPALGCGIL